MYTLRNDAVRYVANFANQNGCNWMGLAGIVFDLAGEHKTGLVVRVYGSGVDTRVTTGSHSTYGISGWEVYITNQPIQAEYHIQLESKSGQVLSREVIVKTLSDCEHNLAFLVFDEKP